jgi:pyruvate formate lyase activating enzyme
MERSEIKGYVHSLQSLGTVDGPGVRFVTFFSGCPLRCKCCHNPDTWAFGSGTEYSASEIVKKAERFRSYFGEKGGITLSGGEPICQSEFATEIFRLCKEKGINTCLDTSGAILNDSVKRLLSYTDRVLLDIKYTNNGQYTENVGTSLDAVLDFLNTLENMKIPTTVRQVIIPEVNDSDENFSELERIIKAHTCVDGLELLPFRKICQVKYDEMGLKFPFSDVTEADTEKVKKLENKLKEKLFK